MTERQRRTEAAARSRESWRSHPTRPPMDTSSVTKIVIAEKSVPQAPTPTFEATESADVRAENPALVATGAIPQTLWILP